MTWQRLATADLLRACQQWLTRLVLLWLALSLVCGTPGVVAVLVASTYLVPTEEEQPERHGSEVEVRHATARGSTPYPGLNFGRSRLTLASALRSPVPDRRRDSAIPTGFTSAVELGAGIRIRC